MKMKRILWGTIVLFLMESNLGCGSSDRNEKSYQSYDDVINVSSLLHPIVVRDVFLSAMTRVYMVGEYVAMADYGAYGEQIHLIDANTYRYVRSTAEKGKGPGEIANMGSLAWDGKRRRFYVSDHSKMKIFSFELDSLLKDALYRPLELRDIKETVFPSEYVYVDDTTCIGRMIVPKGNNDFRPYTGIWNMITGEIRLMKYENKKIERKRMTVAFSPATGLYVEAHSLYDLITIGKISGELVCNVYGPGWEPRLSRKEYYGTPFFCEDKILVPYLNDDVRVKEGGRTVRTKKPKKIVAFDREGNYMKTLNVGKEINSLVYDDKRDRILMVMSDPDMQFAYLDLEGLL